MAVVFLVLLFPILSRSQNVNEIPKPVKAKAGFTKYAAHPGGKIKLTIPIVIDEGWHVFGKNPDIGGIKPLNVEISTPKEIKASAVEYDKPEKIFLDAIKKEAFVYHKKAVATSTLTVSSSAKLKRYFLEAKILYQACSKQRCLLPQTITLKIPLEVVAQNVKIQDIPDKKELPQPMPKELHLDK